ILLHRRIKLIYNIRKQIKTECEEAFSVFIYMMKESASRFQGHLSEGEKSAKADFNIMIYNPNRETPAKSRMEYPNSRVNEVKSRPDPQESRTNDAKSSTDRPKSSANEPNSRTNKAK